MSVNLSSHSCGCTKSFELSHMVYPFQCGLVTRQALMDGGYSTGSTGLNPGKYSVKASSSHRDCLSMPRSLEIFGNKVRSPLAPVLKGCL